MTTWFKELQERMYRKGFSVRYLEDKSIEISKDNKVLATVSELQDAFASCSDLEYCKDKLKESMDLSEKELLDLIDKWCAKYNFGNPIRQELIEMVKKWKKLP